MTRLTLALAGLVVAFVGWRDPSPVHAQAPRSRETLDIENVSQVHLVSNGDVLVLVTETGRSDLTVLSSASGGPFAPTDFVVPEHVLDRSIAGVWSTSRGFFIVRRTRGSIARVSRSVDGAHWEVLDSPAFAAPADIYGMAQLDGGDILAVGALRLGGRSSLGTFRGAMWRSRDGIAWEAMPLSGEIAGAGALGSVATRGATVLVAGRRAGAPTTWRSDDGGASWVVAATSTREFETVAAVGGRFVRIATPLAFQAPEMPSSTSVDGRSWNDGVVSRLTQDGLTFNFRGVTTTPSGLYVEGGAQLVLKERLDWCYAAPSECSRGAGSVLWHTSTGDTWQSVDLGALFGSGFYSVAVADTGAQTVLASATRGHVEVVRTPRASWPVAKPQPAPSFPELPPLVPAGGQVELFTTYRLPKDVHCGWAWLGQINGRSWRLTRQLQGGPDARQFIRGLPQIQQTLLGTIRLTTPDTIEYSLDGMGAIAVYEPTTDTPGICI